MTKEKYAEAHNIEYQPRHSKQMYHVWVVASAAGPVYEYDVFGLDEARKSAIGAWDCEITRKSDGKIVR